MIASLLTINFIRFLATRVSLNNTRVYRTPLKLYYFDSRLFRGYPFFKVRVLLPSPIKEMDSDDRLAGGQRFISRPHDLSYQLVAYIISLFPCVGSRRS